MTQELRDLTEAEREEIAALSNNTLDDKVYLAYLEDLGADDDNVYNTYALPSENPRVQARECKTGANTPRAIRERNRSRA